jgi:hypothetical protein
VAQRRHALCTLRGSLRQRGLLRRPVELPHPHARRRGCASVTVAGLEHPVRAARALLERVLGAGIFPLRREIDETLREKIEKYFWNLTREKPELRWLERWRK